jgi:BirA family biotin operon repressor/biotin-[acetyl-CoA-carboxylase] ligase
LTGADLKILSYQSIDSTNSEATRLIQAGQVLQPLWILAETQDQGRGRQGRHWTSEKGNVFATLVWPAPEMAKAPQTSFIIAVAVQAVLQNLIGNKAQVSCKWPNDILINNRKIAGILLETAKDPKGQDWLIIGIGINLVSKPSDSRWPAIYLNEFATVPTPHDVVTSLHQKWVKLYEIWEARGFKPIAENWMRCAFGLGVRVQYSIKDTKQSGAFSGLDETGAALIRLDSGWVERVYAGEIEFPME